jgi:very-short-patch-repair endonuclease
MSQLRARVRELRKNPTDAERALWQRLRYWQLDGFKFRRQQSIGRYIVDLVCLQSRLIIELDGGQHVQRAGYDRDRDAWLQDQGFIVLRFWNDEVLRNIEGGLERIAEKLERTPYLSPSPQGGRRRKRKPKQAEKLTT